MLHTQPITQCYKRRTESNSAINPTNLENTEDSLIKLHALNVKSVKSGCVILLHFQLLYNIPNKE